MRTTGVALVLASAAATVLGVTPASAASTFMTFDLAYRGNKFPSQSAAINETRPAADRKCVQTYGFRARGVEPGMLYGLQQPDGSNRWVQPWRCYSN
ncbi:hypothetical protein ACFOWZ_27720 [Lentzea rhizosphaerae]|uniref:Uncharacterized protein n=1 Tax=Lentzea rhizosphaerae TaxID=2041025 RepID=A0ABV8BZT6_9PSEU